MLSPMNFSRTRRAAAFLALLTVANLAFAANRDITSPQMRVRVDTEFPRVLEYQWKASGALLYGQEEPIRAVLVNSNAYTPQVRFTSRAKDTALYTLKFPEIKVEMTVKLTVSANLLEFAITDIRERGDFKVRTIAIPNHRLVSVRSTQPGAAFTASQVPKRDVAGSLAGRDADAKPLGFTHAVLNTDQLAASVQNNVLLDSARLCLQTVQKDGYKSCGLWCPVWTYREIDSEIYQLPVARVVVTADVNGDGQVDWQDGAIAFRAIEPLPFGWERTRNRIQSQIAMNFASWAQHPFLRVLDEVKKMYLYTDGLGQEIQFKGYQTEGHDSSHPDYGGNVGTRQGGHDELDYVMRRMKDFNARAGIHINATEYYPEAAHYEPDLVNTNKKGWAWLDQSYYTDLRYDVTSGKLYERLNEMRADLPNLEWVYVDVYFGTGWNAYKLAHKINSLGLPVYTEFEGYLEPYATWLHRPQDWTQKIWGDGCNSRLARFIQNQNKDVWTHDPLVRGSQNDGYLGWHSQRDMNAVIRSTFVVNLPSKYLQHFPIMRWADNRVDFAGGVRSVNEDGTMKIYRGDKLWNTCRYPGTNRPPVECVSFIPWDPINETRIYHWNDLGGETAWTLPTSWQSARTVRLYELTGTGRVFVQEIAVAGGKVTLHAKAKTPYVLYKETPPALPEIVWGEHALVKDPGFDSHSFKWWKASTDAGHVNIVDDNKGQTCLRVQGNNGAGAEISQTLQLQPGKTYSASVWVELKGKRTAALAVRPVGGAAGLVPADRKGWKILKADSEEKRQTEGPAALALDGDPATIWHTQYTGAQPGYPHELAVDMGRDVTFTGFFYTPRQGQANGTISVFEYFVSTDGATWGQPVASGEFSETEVARDGSFRVLLDAPVTARYFRLVAKSEVNGQPFASAAEVGVLVPSTAQPTASKFQGVTARIEKTNLKNYSDNADKYLTDYQRAKVVFDLPAGVDWVDLVLRADAGEAGSIASFDDVRVVQTKRSPQAGHYFFEDFENVDEGWGPFVYGYKGNMRTHLSETHRPYTDDTIDGKYSLKTFDEDNGLNFRTTPTLLRFQPNTKYRLTFDYLTRNDKQYKVVIRSDEGGTAAEALAQDLPGMDLARQRFTAEFTTGAFGDYYVGFVKSAGDKWQGPKVKDGPQRDARAILVIDNFTVDEVK